MKKFMVAFVTFVTIMSVMVMGPCEEAFAQTTDAANETELQMSDLHRAERIFDELRWYIETNPNWEEKVVRLMIRQEEDGVVVAMTWTNEGEWYSDTYYYSHEDLVEIDAYTMLICAQARVAGVWLD